MLQAHIHVCIHQQTMCTPQALDVELNKEGDNKVLYNILKAICTRGVYTCTCSKYMS